MSALKYSDMPLSTAACTGMRWKLGTAAALPPAAAAAGAVAAGAAAAGDEVEAPLLPATCGAVAVAAAFAR